MVEYIERITAKISTLVNAFQKVTINLPRGNRGQKFVLHGYSIWFSPGTALAYTGDWNATEEGFIAQLTKSEQTAMIEPNNSDIIFHHRVANIFVTSGLVQNKQPCISVTLEKPMLIPFEQIYLGALGTAAPSDANLYLELRYTMRYVDRDTVMNSIIP